jgi:hypothetical protein
MLLWLSRAWNDIFGLFGIGRRLRADCWIADKTGRGHSDARASSYEVTPSKSGGESPEAAGESFEGQQWVAAD